MTEEEKSIIRAICDRPEDDLPRLIAADWLEEHGQPERSEFIRVQCELAVLMEAWKDDFLILPESPKGQIIKDLRRRERELLNWHVHEWLFVLPPGLRPILFEEKCKAFRRGFVESVTCTWNYFRRHAKAIIESTPLQEVTLTSSPLVRYFPHKADNSTTFQIEGLELGIRVTDLLLTGTEGTTPSGELVRSILSKNFPTIKKWNLPPSNWIEFQTAGGPFRVELAGPVHINPPRDGTLEPHPRS